MSAQAQAEVADKNAKAAIERANQLGVDVASLRASMQSLEANYKSLLKMCQEQVTTINLIRAQTSYGQILPRLLPQVMAEIEASKND